MRKHLTTNYRYELTGVGLVYDCDCTAPQEKNIYHHLDCASRKNLTLTRELGFLERITERIKGRK